MAHTFDTSALITAGTSNPQAVDYTCGAGATLLVVTLAYTIGTRTGAPTYNGVELTQADQVRKATSGPEACAEIWYLLDPPTGSAYSLSVPNPNALSLEVCISSYKASSGCKSAFNTATGSQSNSVTNPSFTITTSAISVIVAVLADGYATAPTGRTATPLYETGHTTWDSAHQYFLQSAAGAKAMGWTLAADDCGICIAGFHERGTGVDVSKATIYGVVGSQQGTDVSKATIYGVVGSQQGINISKAVIYAVIQTSQRISQFVEEVVTGGVGDQRVSQFVPEAIVGGVGDQRISQFVWEAIVDVQGIKVSQFPVEVVWGQTTPLVDISQAPIEVIWGQSTPLVDLSQFVVEVITSPPATIISQAPVNAIWGMTEGAANVSQTVASAIWGIDVGTAQVSQIVINAIIEPGYSYIGTGGIKFGGTADYVFEPLTSNTYEWTGTGGIKFGGSATTEGPAVRIYSYTGTGGIKFGGSGGVWKNFKLFTGTGGIKFGGTAPYEYGISIAAEALEVVAEGDGETEISQATMAAIEHADEDLNIAQVTTTALIRRKRRDFMPMLTRLMMEHQKEKR